MLPLQEMKSGSIST